MYYYLKIRLKLGDKQSEEIEMGPFGPFMNRSTRNFAGREFNEALEVLSDSFGLEGMQRLSCEFNQDEGSEQAPPAEIEPPQLLTELMERVMRLYLGIPAKVSPD